MSDSHHRRERGPSSKAIILALLCVLAPTAGALSVSAASGDPVTTADAGQIQQYGGQPSYIVHLENSSSPTAIEAWASDDADRDIEAYRNDSETVLVSAPTSEVREFTGLSYRALEQGLGSATLLETLSEVEYVSPNLIIERPRQVSGMDQGDWSSPVGAFKLWFTSDSEYADGIAFSGDSPHGTPADYRQYLNADAASTTGEGVVGAVADTGCYGAQPTGEVLGNGSVNSTPRISNASKSFVKDGEPTVNESGYSAVVDENGHGSWATGAIFANVTANGTSRDEMDGMMPDGTLLCLQVLDSSGSGETDDIARAIRYAADQDADFISLSLGSPVWNKELSKAVSYAHDNGTLVFIATGNSATRGRAPGIATPADVDGAIAVGATNARPAENASRAYFSQFGADPGTSDFSNGQTRGESVDFVAPGYNVSAAVLNGNGLVANKTLSGTSMSTPIVAGSSGLVIGAHPDWTAEEVDTWLTESASRVPNASVHEAGAGYPNVTAAIDQVEAEQSQADAMTAEARFRQNLFETTEGLLGGLF